MKKIFSLVMLLLVILTGNAQPISQQEAMNRAIRFLQSSPAKGSTRRAMTTTPQLAEVTTDMGHLYVFNIDGGGYVIASGDERAVPVLGYSTNGAINWQRIPENMRGWLQSYDEAIASLPQGNIQAAAPRHRASRAVINPLLTTRWNQTPLYNEDCPVYNGKAASAKGKQCLTGCTATAMAQVMYYHKWPQTPSGAIPAYDYEVDNVQTQPQLKETFHLDALPAVTFDWNNMRDKYLGNWNKLIDNYEILPDVTTAQRKAVTTLMRYCGQSIFMKYSPEVSLQYVQLVPLALTTYFGYDKETRCAHRENYTIDQWEELIYNELAANRPVIYTATSDGGGHTFVCDGYDGQGLYHINWGWEGECDDYYSLSVLNSNSYESFVEGGSGYSMFHVAVVGAQKSKDGSAPASTEPELEANSILCVEMMKGYHKISIDFVYFSLNRPFATFEIELFEKLQDGQWRQFTENSEPLELKMNTTAEYIFEFPQVSNETDAVHNLYVRARNKGTSEWRQMTPTYIKYEVRNGKVTIIPQPELNESNFDVKDWQVTRGTGDIKSANEITVTVQNKGDEFNGIFSFTPYYVGNEDFNTAYNTITSPNYDGYYPRYHVLSAGAYLRANSLEPVKFTFTPDKVGNYLFELRNVADPDMVLYYFMLAFPAQVTGIETIKSQEPGDGSLGETGKYYNLAGQQISNPQRGLYIVNGKKVVK